MVPGTGALRGPDGGLRGYSCARGGGSGLEAVLVPRPRDRSVCRPRAIDGGGAARAPRRHRSRGDAAAAARGRLAAGIRTAADAPWGDVFSRVLVEKIEPHLGQGRATILYEYPAVQSPLARPKAADPRLAERFELYACGVELANGFGELVDVVEQRQRLEHQMAEKERIYGERYPIDEDFLSALAVMPEACGIALGFDRLVMLATGATRIDEVVWTPMSAT